jgi:hypothetical protein
MSAHSISAHSISLSVIRFVTPKQPGDPRDCKTISRKYGTPNTF